jgi:uncharacterized protein YjiS (DUF1127 family)
MSLTLGTSRRLRAPKASPIILWRAITTLLGRLSRDAALRRELQGMDDHMLSDLGISRAQMMFEVDRRP